MNVHQKKQEFQNCLKYTVQRYLTMFPALKGIHSIDTLVQALPILFKVH